MEAAIDTSHGRRDDGRVRGVTFDQGRAARQVGAAGGGSVVEHADGVAARNQRLAQVGPDEACSTRHQEHAHAAIPNIGIAGRSSASPGEIIKGWVDLLKGNVFPLLRAV
jgi:hypothetical protein